ncbi:MAG: hypothetical protein NTX82_06500 [Candidatus Parcubacteria bacterium]|nr:hypothetical protein [Candidatus Parcubacteria bacterium]
MFYLALTSQTKILNVKRIIVLGLIIFACSAIYLIPLLLNYSHGSENWQAVFFTPTDFTTFVPWMMLSLKSLIFITGLVGLVAFAKEKFIKANLLVLITAFIYQLINIVIFVLGHKPIQCQKPFLFLGGATLCVGATYLLIYLYQQYLSKFSYSRVIVIVMVIVFTPLLPMINFIDNPDMTAQIEKDLTRSDFAILADTVKTLVPNYKTRIWLSSGTPELNLYIPLNYYLAHNPHFSHPAAIYSQRLNLIQKLSNAKTSDEFNAIINESQPPINSLILFGDSNNYYLYYWHDNYPNAGKELVIKIPQKLISEQYWQKVYSDKDWQILLKK